MDVRPLDDQSALQVLLQRQPLSPFLQSWAWGEFQRSLGRTIWRIGAFENDRLVGSALVIAHELLLGKTYLYCPRGPLADSPEVLTALLNELRRLGQQHGAMYIKIDPTLYHFLPDWQNVAPTYTIGTTLQPEQTSVIDLAPSADTLLEGFHQKTRYNIRLAEKRGVRVRWGSSDDDVQIFIQLMHQTATRQGIRLHSDSYYTKLFAALRTAHMAEIVLAEYEGAPCVANMVVWHSPTVTYLHGGSDERVKDVMAPYAVQWQTILRAKERGCHEYDLWGVAPEDASDHRWSGVTRFKRGFNGRYVVFPPALNAILQPQWYQAYRWAKRMRGGVDA
jgi:lipid II:glycine glycyltransferase (peptidoglycan interpeptide bridge formation enzyme)